MPLQQSPGRSSTAPECGDLADSQLPLAALPQLCSPPKDSLQFPKRVIPQGKRSLCLLVFKEQFTKIIPAFETCFFFPCFPFHKPLPHLCCLWGSPATRQSITPILGVTSHRGHFNTHWVLLLKGFSMCMKLWVLQGGAVKPHGWGEESWHPGPSSERAGGLFHQYWGRS